MKKSALKSALLVIKDDGDSQLDLHMKTQPYVTLAAVKCLVKVACSLVPKEHLGSLTQTITWLRSPTTPDSSFKVPKKPVFIGFVTGPAPCGPVQATLLFRKDDADRSLPFMWIVIGFGNMQLQTFVPFSARDDWDKGKMDFGARYFPLIPLNDDFQFGPNVRAVMDWSGLTAVEADVKIGMHYDLKMETKPPEAAG
jgi:hypothetical protein